MIEFYKKRGETPLQALDRLREEQTELKEETLSYAGRLDPMAEGILPVLVGREENIRRQEFLNKDKEYRAEFIFGIATDTGDVLGVIQKTDFKYIDVEKIKKACENLVHMTEQTYPWYSSKPVNGISLFEHARNGNFDIKRPTKDIKIYSVSDIEYKEAGAGEIITDIISDIKKVEGDFRQGEIVKGWETFLERHPHLDGELGIKSLDSRLRGNDDPADLRGNDVLLLTCTLKVSSGTYIRGLCEVLEEKLGIPVVLHTLVRTQVFT